jgi:ubiquinol-cytochrome c reductase cytochrome c subunit
MSPNDSGKCENTSVSLIESRPFRRFGILLFAIAIAAPAKSLLAANSKTAEQAGATLFRDKGCTYCHGAGGQGTQKGPSLANVRKTMKAAQISAQIENGGQKMPSFSESLSHDEVAQLVAFLRAKHRPAPAPVPTPAQTSPSVSNPGQ